MKKVKVTAKQDFYLNGMEDLKAKGTTFEIDESLVEQFFRWGKIEKPKNFKSQTEDSKDILEKESGAPENLGKLDDPETSANIGKSEEDLNKDLESETDTDKQPGDDGEEDIDDLDGLEDLS